MSDIKTTLRNIYFEATHLLDKILDPAPKQSETACNEMQSIPYTEWQPPTSFPLFEGFESGQLSSIWRIDGRIQTFDGNKTDAVQMQTKIVRAGNYAAKIVVRRGYVEQEGYIRDGKQIHSERTELDAGELPLLDKELWYGFSLYFPKDFPIVDNRLSISQWKQDDDSCKVKNPSPVLSIRFEDGALRAAARLDVDGESKEVFKKYIPSFELGKWHDFIVQIKFSDDGYANIWMNGEKVFEYKGRTKLRGCGNRVYHKVGLYRDELEQPMEMYLDNYSRGFSREEVSLPTPPKDPLYNR